MKLDDEYFESMVDKIDNGGCINWPYQEIDNGKLIDILKQIAIDQNAADVEAVGGLPAVHNFAWGSTISKSEALAAIELATPKG
jgi:hypothetical protein